MISDVVHLQLHAARRADLMREADHERLIRTFRRPRNRRDAAATRRKSVSTSITDVSVALVIPVADLD